MAYVDPEDVWIEDLADPEDRIDLGDGWQEGYQVDGDDILDSEGRKVGEIVTRTYVAETDEGDIPFEQFVAVYYQ